VRKYKRNSKILRRNRRSIFRRPMIRLPRSRERWKSFRRPKLNSLPNRLAKRRQPRQLQMLFKRKSQSWPTMRINSRNAAIESMVRLTNSAATSESNSLRPSLKLSLRPSR